MDHAPCPSDRADDVSLSVVVPAYDEVDRIAGTVTRILRFLDSRPYRSELVIVLDGGRPGAAEQIAGPAAGRPDVSVLDNERNRGKGYSVRRGVLATRGRYVAFVDADLSLPIEDLDRFLDVLGSGADLAIGSRALPESSFAGDQQPFRASLSRVFNWIVQMFLVRGVRDTQCGFKVGVGDRLRAIVARQQIDGFGFDVEMLHIAAQRGYRVVEVPVRCEYHETSSVRRIRHGAAMLRDLARIADADRRGRYRDDT